MFLSASISVYLFIASLLGLLGLLTPVPPTITDVEENVQGLGLWPFITIGLILALVFYVWRRLGKK